MGIKYINKEKDLIHAIINNKNKNEQYNDTRNLRDQMENILINTAKLAINQFDRNVVLESKYDNFLKELEDINSKDNSIMANTNDAMMTINKLCERYDIDILFPEAGPDYDFNELNTASMTLLTEMSLDNAKMYQRYNEKNIEKSNNISIETPSGLDLPRRVKDDYANRDKDIDIDLNIPSVDANIAMNSDVDYDTGL